MIFLQIRRSGSVVDTADDSAVVREVLKWLYWGLDRHKKRLALVLRPYLSCLFVASHENCWFAPEWLRRQSTEELDALGEFSNLVINGKIPPKEGILDAQLKGSTKLIQIYNYHNVVEVSSSVGKYYSR